MADPQDILIPSISANDLSGDIYAVSSNEAISVQEPVTEKEFSTFHQAWICPECHSLTLDREGHADWHKHLEVTLTSKSMD